MWLPARVFAAPYALRHPEYDWVQAVADPGARIMTHLTARTHRLAIGLIGLLFAAQATLSRSAEAQVVLDMPAPPAKQIAPAPPLAMAELSQPAPAQPVTGDSTYETAMAMTRTPMAQTTPQQDVTVGDVALYRYSLARSGTHDTYFEDGLYRAGIRTYSYPRFFPQFVWGPWFFPFHFHSFCW
jgi:hypothetical protein